MNLVRDAMVREVVAVASDTSLEAVARLFAINGVSGAPVIEDSGRPLGVISHPDLADRDHASSGDLGRPVYYRVWNGDVRAMGIVATPTPPAGGVAADVMTTPMITVEQSASVEDAARRMLHEHVHRLFVVENGRVIGVISAFDCLRVLLGERGASRPRGECG